MRSASRSCRATTSSLRACRRPTTRDWRSRVWTCGWARSGGVSAPPPAPLTARGHTRASGGPAVRLGASSVANADVTPTRMPMLPLQSLWFSINPTIERLGTAAGVDARLSAAVTAFRRVHALVLTASSRRVCGAGVRRDLAPRRDRGRGEPAGPAGQRAAENRAVDCAAGDAARANAGRRRPAGDGVRSCVSTARCASGTSDSTRPTPPSASRVGSPCSASGARRSTWCHPASV